MEFTGALAAVRILAPDFCIAALLRAAARTSQNLEANEEFVRQRRRNKKMLCSRIAVVVVCLMPLLSHPLKSEAAIGRAPTQEEIPGREGTPSHDKTISVLNDGTKEELQFKLGVTADEADNIVKNRPYRELSQLKTVVSKKTFKQIQKRTQQHRRSSY
jgi:hypothetical protein